MIRFLFSIVHSRIIVFLSLLALLAIPGLATTSFAASTNINVVTQLSVGIDPGLMVYNPSNKNVYLAIDGGGGKLFVIDSITNKVIAKVLVGQSPRALIYDPSNKEIYVTTDSGVAVLNGIKVVANLAVCGFGGSRFLVYAPSDKDVYVTSDESNLVSIIDGATNKVVDTVSAAFSPGPLVYDSSNKDVYVACETNVSVISTSTNAVTLDDKFPTASKFHERPPRFGIQQCKP